MNAFAINKKSGENITDIFMVDDDLENIHAWNNNQEKQKNRLY